MSKEPEGFKPLQYCFEVPDQDDYELQILSVCVKALEGLKNPESRHNILAYLESRFGYERKAMSRDEILTAAQKLGLP